MCFADLHQSLESHCGRPESTRAAGGIDTDCLSGGMNKTDSEGEKNTISDWDH
jgi:hypothetical protein